MKIFYDPDLDYVEVFFKQTPNYGEDLDQVCIVFKAEKNDEPVGYGLHRPLKSIISAKFLTPQVKIAILCYIKRKLAALSEKDFARELGVSYRTYQRIEEGEINKIEDFIKVKNFISEVDLTKVFKVS